MWVWTQVAFNRPSDEMRERWAGFYHREREQLQHQKQTQWRLQEWFVRSVFWLSEWRVEGHESGTFMRHLLPDGEKKHKGCIYCHKLWFFVSLLEILSNCWGLHMGICTTACCFTSSTFSSCFSTLSQSSTVDTSQPTSTVSSSVFFIIWVVSHLPYHSADIVDYKPPTQAESHTHTYTHRQ